MFNTFLFPFKYLLYVISDYFKLFSKWNYYNSINVPYLELMKVDVERKAVFYRFKYSGKPTPPDAIMNLGKNTFSCQSLVDEINRAFIKNISDVLSSFDKTGDISILPIEDLLTLRFEHNGNKIIVTLWGTTLANEWLKYKNYQGVELIDNAYNLPSLVRTALQSQKTKLELYQENYQYF
jgi:hypothetical protein